jgi:general stress protein YciG
MTAREAGRRGGATRKAAMTPEAYAELGRKGGTVARDRHGPELYSRIGREGGNLILERYGREHFSRMGKVKKGKGRMQKTAPAESDGVEEQA